MLTLPVAGQRIQRDLVELEAIINTAMAKAASLTQTCAEARNLPDVAATAGQPVLLHLASLTQHLVQSAGQVARVHGDLAALNRDLDIVAMPDQGGKCPPLQGALEMAVA